jgi:hypothetical protein
VLSRTMFGSIGLFYCSMLFAAVVTKPLKAQEMATLPQTFEQSGVIKQIEHEHLLISIENWLSSQFNLPTINRHPRIELVAPSTIASLGYKKLLSDPSVVAESETTGSQSNTVSLYDDVTQTIYLPKGWTGSADVEVSILVHEMVHHFQNLLRRRSALCIVSDHHLVPRPSADLIHHHRLSIRIGDYELVRAATAWRRHFGSIWLGGQLRPPCSQHFA